MKISYRIKYPCGLMMEYSAKGFGIIGTFDDKIEVCPLHNNKCKSN